MGTLALSALAQSTQTESSTGVKLPSAHVLPLPKMVLTVPCKFLDPHITSVQGQPCLLEVSRGGSGAAQQDRWRADVSAGAVKAFLVGKAAVQEAASWFPGMPTWKVWL